MMDDTIKDFLDDDDDTLGDLLTQVAINYDVWISGLTKAKKAVEVLVASFSGPDEATACVERLTKELIKENLNKKYSEKYLEGVDCVLSEVRASVLDEAGVLIDMVTVHKKTIDLTEIPVVHIITRDVTILEDNSIEFAAGLTAGLIAGDKINIKFDDNNSLFTYKIISIKDMCRCEML